MFFHIKGWNHTKKIIPLINFSRANTETAIQLTRHLSNIRTHHVQWETLRIRQVVWLNFWLSRCTKIIQFKEEGELKIHTVFEAVLDKDLNHLLIFAISGKGGTQAQVMSPSLVKFEMVINVGEFGCYLTIWVYWIRILPCNKPTSVPLRELLQGF